MSYDVLILQGSLMATNPPDCMATAPLARTGIAPLFLQLKQRIGAAIAESSYPAGSSLPSEAQLCALYSVSRVTVRRAISMRQDEGALQVRHGKGTFVTARQAATCIVGLDGFQESFSLEGCEPESVFLKIEEIMADDSASEALDLSPCAPVLAARRLIRTRTQVLGLEIVQCASTRYPGLAGLLRGGEMDINNALARLGHRPAHVIRKISVRPGWREELTHLGFLASDPVLHVEKVIRGSDMTPMVHSVLFLPCSRTVLVSE